MKKSNISSRLKTFKPTTPTLRHLKLINLQKYKLNKLLLKTQIKNITRKYGHNNKGHYTSFHKGGGHKRVYRFLNMRSFSYYAIVTHLEYDPYRTAFLMQLYNPFLKKYFYQLAPQNIRKGSVIRFKLNKTKLKLGHTTVLKNIAVGTIIHNISFNSYPNTKTRIASSAGLYAQLIQKSKTFCKIKLKSGRIRYIPKLSVASVGKISNPDHKLIKLGKAGRSRWLNRRPIVRGVAMNPIDHPHGGGAGKTSAGRPSVSPWGKLTKNVPTRNKKKNNYIIEKKK